MNKENAFLFIMVIISLLSILSAIYLIKTSFFNGVNKDITFTGTIISIDVSGSPITPFVTLALDDGTTITPIKINFYASLSGYLNQRVTMTFHYDGYYTLKEIQLQQNYK